MFENRNGKAVIRQSEDQFGNDVPVDNDTVDNVLSPLVDELVGLLGANGAGIMFAEHTDPLAPGCVLVLTGSCAQNLTPALKAVVDEMREIIKANPERF